MKSLRNACLVLLCALPTVACSTTNLVRWASDEPSIYHEPDSDFSSLPIAPPALPDCARAEERAKAAGRREARAIVRATALGMSKNPK